MDHKLTLFQKVWILLFYKVKVGTRTGRGWKNSQPLYAFWCSECGDYRFRHITGRGLRCPVCWGYDEAEYIDIY